MECRDSLNGSMQTALCLDAPDVRDMIIPCVAIAGQPPAKPVERILRGA